MSEWPVWQVQGTLQQMETIEQLKLSLAGFGLGVEPDFGSGVSGAYFVPNADGTIDLQLADNSLDTYEYTVAGEDPSGPPLTAHAAQQAMRQHMLWLYKHVLEFGWAYDELTVENDTDPLGHYTVLRIHP